MSRRPQSAQSGLTLVELIIAVAIFAVVGTASATLYTSVVTLSLKSRLAQDVQRSGDAVLANYSQNLKGAVSLDSAASNFTSTPHVLAVRLESGQTRRWYVEAGRLHYVSETGTDQTITEPAVSVTALTYAVSSSEGRLTTIRITGTLSTTSGQQTQTYSLASSITPRPQ